MKLFFSLLLCLALAAPGQTFSKSKKAESTDTTDLMKSAVFNGLELRSIGPGITSGRITDIAVNPNMKSEWYIGVACGGVWKTTNGGITFNSIFDNEASFSIGCITIDPNDQFTVWVGSGENNSQRSVSYGDGVYKSTDAGKSWKNMGLKHSEHIGKIIVDPRNSNVVYVAAQGPLWDKGGDRGVYKTTDGGATWEQVLKIDEYTGAADVEIDPKNPDVLYAATYQRMRRVWTIVDGGPGSAIYKSVDAGKTWNKLTSGLPSGDLGKIGIGVSPVNPDYVYATIEATEGGGLFRSTDRGASWTKMNPWFSPAAMYYQEIVCDPKDVNKLYDLDTYVHVTDDGGKTFRILSTNHRHVDDHALWIDPANTDHYLIGGDGGVYETYDDAVNWRYFANLPVTQYYRVGIDNAEPFYNVYGGTQDNNSWGGPSQTTNSGGITNQDWYLVVGGDGYQARVDPEDPNVVYGQWQYGNLIRYDRKSGEVFYIQPQAEKGEALRWNWDTPLIVSPHSHTRIYIAANKLFESDDRGDSWKCISPDLSRQIDRNQLEIMGKVWGPDAVAKNASTSLYGNAIALSESPVKEGLIFVGTDDGVISMTNDDGKNWTRDEKFAGVPETTYVSDIFTSNFDENVVYASFDNHKNGDFKPYLLESNDKGASWHSIASNLPENGVVYTIYQDVVDPKLLFAGTEFGLFFSPDDGGKWIQLKGKFRTIAVRDLEIQKRENDLVVATFGRGFYILDDISPLRKVSEDAVKQDHILFPVKDALMFVLDDSRSNDDQGGNFFRTPNPPFGATFTYYTKDPMKTKKQMRDDSDAKLTKENKTPPYPTMDELRAEDNEEAPYLIFKVLDSENNTVRIITAPASSGIKRITWDLRYPYAGPVAKTTDPNKNSGMPVMPGKYKVVMGQSLDGKITMYPDTVEFTCKLLNNAEIATNDRQALVDFQKKVARLQNAVFGTNSVLSQAKDDLELMKKSLLSSVNVSKELLMKTSAIEQEFSEINIKLNGDPSIGKRSENQTPSISDRLGYCTDGVWSTNNAPTKTQKDSYTIASEQLTPVLEQLKNVVNVEMKNLNTEMDKLGSPWTPGRIPEWNGN